MEKELFKLIEKAVDEGKTSVVTFYLWGSENADLIKFILTKAGYKVSKYIEDGYPYSTGIAYIKIDW